MILLSQYTALKPLGDRVLVKIKTAEEKTGGGILLPSSAQTKPQGGEVVAVGEGRTIGKNKIDISLPVNLLVQEIFNKHCSMHVVMKEKC